jgi:hypothetical protein
VRESSLEEVTEKAEFCLFFAYLVDRGSRTKGLLVIGIHGLVHGPSSILHWFQKSQSYMTYWIRQGTMAKSRCMSIMFLVSAIFKVCDNLGGQ